MISFQVVLGYSLDAMPDLINQAYIVSAHVQETAPRGRWGVAEEKFTALCLPGMLPGFFMSYNHHGFAYCVNTISTGIPVTDKQTRKISFVKKRHLVLIYLFFFFFFGSSPLFMQSTTRGQQHL